MTRSYLPWAIVTVSLLAFASVVMAGPLGNGFTYQGRLADGGVPADGTYNFTFSLWDAAGSGNPPVGGTQIGGNVSLAAAVTDGLFTVQLNEFDEFGVGAFDGDERWLQISVDGTTLAPRQPLTAAPYALYALSGPGGSGGSWSVNGSHIYSSNAGNVGIGTNNPSSAKLHVQGGAGQWGLRVTSESPNPAVYATLNGNGGTAAMYGVTGSTGVGAMGVHGLLSATAPGSGAAGVRGTVSGTSNVGYGVYGRHGGGGIGVFGESLSTSAGRGVVGDGFWGVWGEANSANGYGGVFVSSEGIFGTGQALLVAGDGEVSDSLLVGRALAAPGEAKLHVVNGTDTSPGGGGFLVLGDTTGLNISIDNNEIMARNNGQAAPLHLNTEGGASVRVAVLEIMGADVAEKFPISEARDLAEPGTVMEIDPENAGKLRVARGAYSRRVAGVVSGAGDIPLGAVLGNLPGHEDAPPIALSGRVWVRCDAATGPIEPGDLLTTSDHAGHAMTAADPSRAYGAVIGKAMSALPVGETGLVLVLVSLQ